MNSLTPYQLACKKLGIKPRPILKNREDKDRVSEDAFHRLTICIRAKNMIGDKVWNAKYDGSEWHYYPRWKQNKSGFGLSYHVYGDWDTDARVGARLEYRTYDLMLEGVKEFDEYYQDYYAI